MSKLQEIEARRAARKAQLVEQREEQRATDLEAVDTAEIEHGDSNVCTLDVPYTPGLPTLCAAKTPNPAVVKRYRDQVKTRRDGTPGDTVGAAELVADACLVYPDRDTFQSMCAARAGVKAQLGLQCLKLAAGHAEAEGKD